MAKIRIPQNRAERRALAKDRPRYLNTWFTIVTWCKEKKGMKQPEAEAEATRVLEKGVA